MASSPNSIFITNVEGFGDLLKIWGQRNRTCATYMEKQLMQLLPEFNAMPPPPANRLDRGVIYFAKRSDGKYYRARVISDVDNNRVTVLFIDYGHRGTVELSNIRLLSGATESVLFSIVPQGEEFFLANIASCGGWFEEVLNEVRRDLCYKEYNYKFELNSYQKFIYIMYDKEDYTNILLRRNFGTRVQVADQVLFLKYKRKSQEQMGNFNPMLMNPGTAQPGPQFVPKFQPKQIKPQANIPDNLVQVPQVGLPNNINQSAALNCNNNSILQNNSNVTQVVNSVMIEALADQLKQHLFKNSVCPPDTTTHTYISQVLEVGTTHSIYVSYIDDGPWSFSIQLVASEHELNQLMDDLAACDLIPIKLPVVLGYPCIAKSQEYDNYCRGVVVNVSHSAVKIFFVDFGNAEDLPVSSIFELPVKFFKVKTMSQKFALNGLQKIKPSPEIKKAFIEVVENEVLLLHVTTLEGENLPTCDLYLRNVNIKRILNEKVLQMRKWTPLQLPKPGEVEDVVVTWIDSPQKFYVQLKKYDRELENLKMELAEWGANGELFNPDDLVPGSLCVCRFTGDNEWYRAIVTSIKSKKSVTVFYVDFGNTEDVQPSAIKKIGGGLIRQLHAQAIQCCLHEFESKEVDSNAKMIFESLILEKEVQLKVIYTDKDHIVVKLFDKNNDISLSLIENTKTSESLPKYPGGEANNVTFRSKRAETDVGFRRNDMRNKTPSSRNKSEGTSFSWRKDEGKSPRSDLSSEGGCYSDDSKKDWKGEDDRWSKSKRGGFPGNRWEIKPGEKNWRNQRNAERKKEVISERGQEKPLHTKRAKRVAEVAHEQGTNTFDMKNMKYPVKLENVAFHRATIKIKDIPIGSVEKVTVVYFRNPHEIYVQLLPPNKKFKKFMDEMQSYYATKLHAANFPKKGDMVAAKFKGDDVLYRARVVESNPYTVHYVDYGNEEVTVRERVWPMDKKFLELEAQAIKCSLPNLIPNGSSTWSLPGPEIDKIFESESYSCKFLNRTDGVYEVCLTITENGKNVRDELISIGLALPAENKTAPPEGIKKCPSMDFTLMRNESYKAYVSHVADPSEFYIQVELDTLHSVEDQLKKWSESQKSIAHLGSDSVSVDGLYLGSTDGENWRRIKILKKGESGAFVQFIDYGEKLDIPYQQIKPMTDQVLEYITQAVQCCLFNETGEYSSDIAETFKECDKKIFIAYVHDILENGLGVTLYNTGGEILEFLSSVNDAPAVIRRITSVPITRQGIKVVASHIVSPKVIYIQRKSDMPALERLKQEMLKFYTNGGEDFEAGSKICAVKSTVDGHWYRARVLMPTKVQAKVFYLDYGKTEDVPLENMRKLNPVYEEKHAFCRKISLNVDYDADAETELTDLVRRMIAGAECVGYFGKLDDVMYGELIIDGGAVSDRLLSDKVKKVADSLFRDVPEAEKADEMIEKDFGVFISHVSSPGEFWVHHESISYQLEEFQDKLQRFCLKASRKKDFRVGDVVGALHTDQLWFRSRVVAVEDSGPIVQFIDYGNSLKIDYSEVVELTEDLAKAPPFANCCSLKGQWKDTAALRFEEIITINQDPFILVELEDGQPRVVDLVQNGVSVTEQLISEGYGIGNGDNPDDDDVYITHINTPNDFYIQREGDKSLFDTLISGLLEADLFQDVDEIKENEVYCAKFPENKMWYRAKVLKKSERGAFVHFIDYGNDASVTDIKLLPSEFLTIPPLSLNCCLLYGHSNDTWSEAACKKFMEYVNDSSFRMEIVLPGEQRNVIKLFTEDGENVTEILENLCEKDDREFVCITHINSPNDFYVQRVDNQDFDVIEERLKAAETFEDVEKKEVGMICCAKFEDSTWHRVKLRSISDNLCDVFFIDVGSFGQARELKSLPEDVKEIEPLVKNCSLHFPVANIPESIKEEFVRLTEQNSMLRARVIQPGDRDVVSLILDGMKLEEVLLYSISETSEIYKIPLDVENQSIRKTEPGEEYQVRDEYQDENFDDDVRAGNETDEEKRVKFAIKTSENTEGFRSDDEKGIMEGLALNSSVVNFPDNELLEETITEAEDTAATGEETEEIVSEEPEVNGSVGREDEITNASTESTKTSKYYKETESRGQTACEPDITKEEADAEVEGSSTRQETCQEVHEDPGEPKKGIPTQKFASDEEEGSAAVNESAKVSSE